MQISENRRSSSSIALAAKGAATLFLAYLAFDSFSKGQVIRATLFGVGATFPGWIYLQGSSPLVSNKAEVKPPLQSLGPPPSTPPSIGAQPPSTSDQSESASNTSLQPLGPPPSTPSLSETLPPSTSDQIESAPNTSLQSLGPTPSTPPSIGAQPSLKGVSTSSFSSVASPSYPTKALAPAKENPDYWIYLKEMDPSRESGLPDRIKKFREKIKELIDTKQHLGKEGQDADGFLHVIANLIIIYYPRASKWERQYPEMTGVDTLTHPSRYSCQILYHLQSGIFEQIFSTRFNTEYLAKEKSAFLSSAHGPAFSYSDDQIIEVIAHPHYSRPDGKRPLFQSGQRGCCGATGAMIASDLLGRECEVIKGLNLSSSDRIAGDLESFGLEPIRSEVSSLEELRQKLEEHNCSAQVSVESCGSHVVIVDSVQVDRVEIRDPYHGWAVALKVDDFMRSWRSPDDRGPSVIYQARLPHSS